MNELNMRISAYLPAFIRRRLDNVEATKLPETQTCSAITMFADVSGFTAMTESLATRGPVGAECLGKHLNSYFEQMLRLISSAGGDVFKFAGDAMIVFWPENREDSLETLLRRCLQCAFRIQEHLHKAELAPNIILSVKMGIGIGKISIAHLGGLYDGVTNRIEYIAVGPGLMQAFDSESCATAGDVICSPEAWQMIGGYFSGQAVNAKGFHKVLSVTKPIKLISRRPSFQRDDPQLYARMKQYVPRAVWPYVNAREETWGSELRDVTVLFINLGFTEHELTQADTQNGINRLHQAFTVVQSCIYTYEGTINKFLVDDKGSSVIAVFGLPPVAHENDAIRGILASLAICAQLQTTLNHRASIGITSGTAFCGVVGHQGNRREYTVLGDIVNLSARLMQRAKQENGGVITDESTKESTQSILFFETRLEIMVKGKNERIKIHRPYPRMSTLMQHSLRAPSLNEKAEQTPTTVPVARKMTNVMQNMHEVQLITAHRRLSLISAKSDTLMKAAVKNTTSESTALQNLRQQLVSACNDLTPHAVGSTFILEADIGLGKTRLLRSVTASSEVNSSRQFLLGTGNPFLDQRHPDAPYAVWVEMIKSLEDYAVANVKSTRSPHIEEDAWTTFIASHLRPDRSSHVNLLQYAHILNTVLGTEFPLPLYEDNNEASRLQEITQWVLTMLDLNVRTSSANLLQLEHDPQPENHPEQPQQAQESGKDLKTRESFFTRSECDENAYRRSGSAYYSEDEIQTKKLDLKGVLLLCILFSISREQATVYIIDNAMYIDDNAWTLATIISKYFTNSLLIVATRPPASIIRNINNSRCLLRQSLKSLMKLPTTTRVVLEPLAPIHTEQMARSILHVDVVPQELCSILVSRSQGNPLFLMELIHEMLNQGVINVDSHTKTCETSAQEPWQKKQLSKFCFDCHVRFDSIKDTHRCKCCGYVFCDTCTPKGCRQQLLDFQSLLSNTEAVRHCRNCYSISRMRRPSNSVRSKSISRRAKSKSSLPSVQAIHSALGAASGFSSNASHTEMSPLKNRIALKPPPTIKSVLTTWLDRLSVSQRMVLKTAAVIGNQFPLDALRGTYPIEDHLPRLERDLIELQRSHLIRQVEVCMGSLPVKPERTSARTASLKYEFCHGFMVDVLQSQMLSSQMDRLFQRLHDYQENHDKELRKAFYVKLQQQQNVGLKQSAELQLRSGPVQVRKRPTVFDAIRPNSGWKKRFAVLRRTCLILQYEESTSEQVLTDRDTILFLDENTVIEIAGATKFRPHCFCLHVQKWQRQRRVLDQPRDFIFCVESALELDHWEYMIKYALESIGENNSPQPTPAAPAPLPSPKVVQARSPESPEAKIPTLAPNV